MEEIYKMDEMHEMEDIGDIDHTILAL